MNPSLQTQILIVGEREQRAHARNLVRAGSNHHSMEWCFHAEFEARMRTGLGRRNVFLGNSKYASFLRGLAKGAHRKHGIVWSTYKQHAFVYTEDTVIDMRSTLPKLRAKLQQLKTDAQYKADASTYTRSLSHGPTMANAYLDLVSSNPVLTIDRTVSNEQDLRRAVVENQLVVGIAWFLMEGWDTFVAQRAVDPSAS